MSAKVRKLTFTLSLAGAAALLASTLACRSGLPPIVFTSDRDGNREIYSVRADGNGGETNLTQSATHEFAPALAPDGRRVAYVVERDGRMQIDGQFLNGEDRAALYTGNAAGAPPRWEPNGDRIAFTVVGDFGSTIQVSNLQNAESILLTNLQANRVGGWSPNGDLILFSVEGGEQQGLYVRNPDGVNEVRRTNTLDAAAGWSRDAEFIAYVSERDGNPEVYVSETGEGGKELRVTDTPAPEYDLAWSPRENKLLFVSERDGNAEIYVATIGDDGATSDLQRLTHNEVRDAQPVWSPNGKMIAFVSYLDGDAEIFVMRTDGADQQRLTNNAAEDTDPSW